MVAVYLHVIYTSTISDTYMYMYMYMYMYICIIENLPFCLPSIHMWIRTCFSHLKHVQVHVQYIHVHTTFFLRYMYMYLIILQNVNTIQLNTV